VKEPNRDVVMSTERLVLRRFTTGDAAFMLRLLNEPSFITNIGDRNVRSVEQAAAYIESGPLESYRRHGFGIYVIELTDGTPIGTCGLLKRDELPEADIGYSLLRQFWSQGFALEAARAVCEYARDTHGLARLVAIVAPGNDASARLLQKIGFTFERMIEFGEKRELLRLFGVALEPMQAPLSYAAGTGGR
jgi:ribosomal-protein-alanine N-acetyltransferase